MAHPATRKVKKGSERLFPSALARRLSTSERRAVHDDARALLLWQKDFAVWKRPRNGVDSVPFVTLYSRGRLLGCFGSQEGAPGDRFARAFLRAMNDMRYGGVGEAHRETLVVEVSYVLEPKPIRPDDLVARFEPGTHGLGVALEGRFPVILLPGVARDHGYRARALLDALVRKAKIEDVASARFFSFETDGVVVRGDLHRRKSAPERPSPAALAAAWLARLVRADGSVVFGIDARTGAAVADGEMHHARSAVVVQALAAHGGNASRVALARGRFERDAKAALSGGSVAAWPKHPAQVAGTLAHMVRAGVDVRDALVAIALQDDARTVPWHAAQVAAALGVDTPEILWRACVQDLRVHPWAPWTVLGATLRQDSRVLEGAVNALVVSVRDAAPHRGGVGVTEVPEVALTALTVEALRGVHPTREVRAALSRGKAFLWRWQVTEGNVPAPLDPSASVGAFVASPVGIGLRGDVSGHAYLALR